MYCSKIIMSFSQTDKMNDGVENCRGLVVTSIGIMIRENVDFSIYPPPFD